MEQPLIRRALGGLWLLPVYGVLTFFATFTHQPDPASQFQAWSEYVTTTRFYASHIVGSILGLGLGTLGIISLAVVLAGVTHRSRAATWGVVFQVLGGSIVFGLFGVAAFVQPAIGSSFLAGNAEAQAWYDSVFQVPGTLVPSVVGLVMFSLATVLLGIALAAHPGVPRWAAIAFGASGPFIGLFGVLIGESQTVGSVLLVASSAVIAMRMRAGVASTADDPVDDRAPMDAPHR
jgi:hypothetical protein